MTSLPSGPGRGSGSVGRGVVRRWQLWEEAAREAVELRPGPISRPGPQTLILQRIERRDRPDGPLSPNRGPVRLERSGATRYASLGCREGRVRPPSSACLAGRPRPGEPLTVAMGTTRPARGGLAGAECKEGAGWLGSLMGVGPAVGIRIRNCSVGGGECVSGQGFGKRMALSGGGRKLRGLEIFPWPSFERARFEELFSP